MSNILKPGWQYKTYNTGELPCAGYVQELRSPEGKVFKRSKGTLMTDGSFSPECPVEYFRGLAPEAFFGEGEVTLVTEGKGSPSYSQQGDVWVRVLSGLDFRALVH